MAKRKLYAVIHRFIKPQDDGSLGVVILDRKHGWKPTKRERAEIDDLCDFACDLIEEAFFHPTVR
jgi:hypothetical protein